MNKTVPFIIILLLLTQFFCVAVGINLSYFVPWPLETGYLSIPVPPLNFELDFVDLVPKILTLGLDIGLIYMPAYSLSGLNFPLTAAPLGPSTAFESAVHLKLSLPIGPVSLSAIGGGFCFYYFDLKMNKGNFDRDLMASLGWNALTSNLNIANNWGFGYKYGGLVSVEIMPKVKINLKGVYYYGQADAPISGKITGGTTSISTQDYGITSSSLYTGIKITVGGSYDL